MQARTIIGEALDFWWAGKGGPTLLSPQHTSQGLQDSAAGLVACLEQKMAFL